MSASPINSDPVTIEPLNPNSADMTSDPATYESHHVHKIYDSIAPHFSQTRYKPWPVVEAFLRGQEAGSVGIDVGCGNGKYLGLSYGVDDEGGSGERVGDGHGKRKGGGSGAVTAKNGEVIGSKSAPQKPGRSTGGPVFIIGCDRSQPLVRIAAQLHHQQPTRILQGDLQENDFQQVDVRQGYFRQGDIQHAAIPPPDTRHRRLTAHIGTANDGTPSTSEDREEGQQPSSHQQQHQHQRPDLQSQIRLSYRSADQKQTQDQAQDHGHDRTQAQGSRSPLPLRSVGNFGDTAGTRLTQATSHGYTPTFTEDSRKHKPDNDACTDADADTTNPPIKPTKPPKPTPISKSPSKSLATVLQADSLSLPYPSNTFDFAICIAVIHHLASRERRVRAVGEILRVLRSRNPGRRGRRRTKREGKGERLGIDGAGGRSLDANCDGSRDERQADSEVRHSPERECDGDKDKETDSENDLHQTQPQQDNPSRNPPNPLSGDRPGQALLFVWALEQKSSRRGWDTGDVQDQLVPWILKTDVDSVSQIKRNQIQQQKQGRTSVKSSNSRFKKHGSDGIGARDGGGSEAVGGKDHHRATLQSQSASDGGKDRAHAGGDGAGQGRDMQLQLGRDVVEDEAVQVEKQDDGIVRAETSKASARADEAVRAAKTGSAGGEPRTFHRFYHLYAKGELEAEVVEAGGIVVDGGYERDNWWVVIKLGR